MKTLFLSLLLVSQAQADVLFKAPKKPVASPVTQAKAVSLSKSQTLKVKPPAALSPAPQRSWAMIGEGPTTIVNSNAAEIQTEIKVGSAYEIEIPMSLMAFTDGKVPIVANMRFQGLDYRLLGDATVEKNSKCISVEFKKIRLETSSDVFDFKAQMLSKDGTFGIEGEVHSGKLKFFLAELLSAAAAAFTDASVNRPVNALGNQYEENSLDTSSKKALTGALAKTGEHFAEEMKSDPEFVTIDGPLRAGIIVQEMPKRKMF